MTAETTRIAGRNRARDVCGVRALGTGGLVLVQSKGIAVEAEIAWAAGVFEGEGTWGYQRRGMSANVRAEVAMTDHAIVKRFHRIVGVGRIEPKTKKTYAAHHKPQLLWRVTDRAGVQTLLDLFRPWLGARRLTRGEEILRLQAEVIAANARRRDGFCKNGHPRTAENTYTYWHKRSGKPARACSVCRVEATRASRARAGLVRKESAREENRKAACLQEESVVSDGR